MSGRKTHAMALDGLMIEVSYNDALVNSLFEFLLADLAPVASQANEIIARYTILQSQGGWALSLQGRGRLVEYNQLYDLVIAFFDHTMTILAQHNQSSLSMHAALVSDAGGSILLPGMPGSGKTSISLWLSHLGMYYHSDEMVTINRESLKVNALMRPYTLKNTVIDALRKSLELSFEEGKQQGRIYQSRLNTWIDHRLINPDIQENIPALKAILFPVYTSGDKTGLSELSKAHVGMELMRSHFQSQRFEDHGFPVISKLARDLPAYMMVYNDFYQVRSLVGELLEIA